jgi:2-methylisocitrate lyase-like PEP mutase family enzyme
MTGQSERAQRFLARHHGGDGPLLLANAWDAGTAMVLASLGFEALATTSSGHAATLGRFDGAVSRDEAIAHAAAIVAATELPVSADLENGFADDPAGVAQTVRLALGAGLAGCSIEDYTGHDEDPIYPLEAAAERVATAARTAHEGPVHLVLTARAENHVHGRDDLGDTIARLLAYQAAGADVLYPTGLTDLDAIRTVLDAVDLPVNILARPGLAPVAELAAAGVRRISVGGGFAFAALGTLVEAAQELRTDGTYGFLALAGIGSTAARSAFAARDGR